MNIHYASDLHLRPTDHFEDLINTTNSPFFPTILILAGDLGNPTSPLYHQFFQYLAQQKNMGKYQEIILVAGNHEYHGDTLVNRQAYLKDLSRDYHFVYLHNEVYTYGTYSFCGTTFWTYIPPFAESIIQTFNKDYRKIKDITPTIINKEHEKSYQLIDQFLRYDQGKKIVITHHAPLYSLTAYPLDPKNYAYVSECPELVERADVWIFGHTHFPTFSYHKKCRLLSNPRGYLKENLPYLPDKTIFLP